MDLPIPDSNLQPSSYKSNALPTELTGLPSQYKSAIEIWYPNNPMIPIHASLFVFQIPSCESAWPDLSYALMLCNPFPLWQCLFVPLTAKKDTVRPKKKKAVFRAPWLKKGRSATTFFFFSFLYFKSQRDLKYIEIKNGPCNASVWMYVCMSRPQVFSKTTKARNMKLHTLPN